MIRGVHALFYSSQADELRAFLRDKLELTCTDVGEGWLVFDLPDAEMGCHPAEPENGVQSGTPHISFYVDDLEDAVATLQERGVEFTAPIEDHGYGLVTFFRVPGDFTVQLYQPRYQRKPAKKPRAKRAKPVKKAAPKAKTAARRPKPKSRAGKKR